MFLSNVDLSSVTWHAFSREAMFDRRWYLRSERLVIYTATMLLGMAAQGAATYCMFKYKNLRTHISNFSMHAAHVHDRDIIASAILTMIFPTFLALLLNIEYFLLLFWPGKRFPRRYIAFKKWGFVGVTVGMMLTILLSTVIVATHSASISGVDAATAQQLTDLYFRPPFKYRSWPQNIAWLVLMWITVVLNLLSLVLMLLALSHDEKEGSMTGTAIASSSDTDNASTGTGNMVVQGGKEAPDVVVEEKSVMEAA
jgi:uncharacterized Tic20 family protein